MGAKPPQRILLSWSSGKDSAWCLHVLRQRQDLEVVGLFTTFNEAADRVAMHAVRREIVERQAHAAGLPLHPVMLPWPCSNADYEQRVGLALETLRSNLGIGGVAFGDLFLEEVRRYREEQLRPSGLDSHFPLWGTDTKELAREMVAAGTEAILTCVDPRQCPAALVGRRFDRALLKELPDGVDPCGENGEFHTCVYAHPTFRAPLEVVAGRSLERDGFCYADLRLG